MLVTGGRSWWRRALAGGGWLSALGLWALVSCGGRTSALDPDVYGTDADGFGDGDEAGSSSGGSSGGRPTGAGAAMSGGGSTPTAGGATSGGASAVNPTLSLQACSQYCPGYGTQCKQRLMGQDCLTACQAEVNSFGTRCQALGIDALNCLTPSFTPNGANCEGAVNAALTKCGKIVNAFQECKQGRGPTKPSMPMTNVDVTTCGNMGFVDATTCLDAYSCSTGFYTVLCSYSPSSTTATCSCSRPSGDTASATFENDGKACFRAARTLCQ
ncbi:MAG: hypothetical protein EOO73_35090 [Myxococcales bacterium]|nr:MAG: hypothetical protein EOO73_35090 [Myxococcales bacterium]